MVLTRVVAMRHMILGFKCKGTQSLFEGRRVKRWVNIETVAMRKLAKLNPAVVLSDLKIQPQNSMEALKKDRRGHHSIRINDQWRLCFRWFPAGPENVEIVDYH